MNDETYRVAADELRSFVERVERINAEIADQCEARKEVMAEAKGRGYDSKVLAKVIARRKMERDERSEGDAILSLYEDALEGRA